MAKSPPSSGALASGVADTSAKWCPAGVPAPVDLVPGAVSALGPFRPVSGDWPAHCAPRRCVSGQAAQARPISSSVGDCRAKSGGDPYLVNLVPGAEWVPGELRLDHLDRILGCLVQAAPPRWPKRFGLVPGRGTTRGSAGARSLVKVDEVGTTLSQVWREQVKLSVISLVSPALGRWTPPQRVCSCMTSACRLVSRAPPCLLLPLRFPPFSGDVGTFCSALSSGEGKNKKCTCTCTYAFVPVRVCLWV